LDISNKKTVPYGYWTYYENIEKKLKEIINKIGHFPTKNELNKMNLGGLANAIHLYHGGMFEVQKKMKIKSFSRRPSNYWSDFENVKKELIDLKIEIGRFPTFGEIEKNNLGLANALKKHGGIYSVKEKLKEKQVRVKRNHWKDFDNIKVEIQYLIDKLGRFPTYGEIGKYKKSIYSPIFLYHGGIHQVRKKMGYDQLQFEHGHWKFFSNIEKELKELEKTLSKFPTFDEVKKFKPYLLRPILEYHGGYYEVRDKLKIEQLRNKRNHWKNFENIKKELMILKEKLGRFPDYDDLVKNKQLLISPINRYHGGLVEIRESLGFSKPSISSLERSVKEILEKYIDDNFFIDNKRKDLLNYGLNMKNPDTGLYLEIDRFYPELKVAFEIQGVQHYSPGGEKSFWTEERFERIIHLDKLKRKLLKNQNVFLIEIPYNKCSEKDILIQLNTCSRIKLKRTN